MGNWRGACRNFFKGLPLSPRHWVDFCADLIDILEWVGHVKGEPLLGVWIVIGYSMELLHVRSMKHPSSVIDCNGIYIAAALDKTCCGVWSTQSIDSKPLELVAHRQPVTSLAFGRCLNPSLLCTSAEDYVIVWNIEEARHLYETGQQIKGQILVRKIGPVTYTCFSSDDTLVSLCLGNEVQIFNLPLQELHTTLEGHTSPVTCAAFCDHLTDVIITAAEDRTFKIWDLRLSVLIYQSNIISAYPFVSIAVDPFEEILALGSTDGQVRVYDIRAGKGYKLLHQLSIDKLAQRDREQPSEPIGSATTISSRPCSIPKDDDSHSLGQAGEVVLSLCFHQLHSRGRKMEAMHTTGLKPDEHTVDNLMEDSSYLLVGTPGSVSVIHTKSFEGTMKLFQDSVHSGHSGADVVIPVAGYLSFGCLPGVTKPWCITSSAFQGSLEVMQVNIPTDSIASQLHTQLHLDEVSNKEISVIANTPLLDNSVLRSEMTQNAGGKKAPTKPTSKKSAGKIQDQPLTFQQKIRSSGYTSAPRTKMFSPKTSHGSHTATKTKSLPTGKNRHILKEFPMMSDPPRTRKQSLQITANSSVITDLKFSDDGQYLASAHADKCSLVFKMPLTAGTCTCLTGHNSVVNTVDWSHDGAWLLTSSDDKTAKVWMRGSTDSIMTMSHVKSSQDRVNSEPKGTVTKKDNPAFTHAIKHAQFYYVDKFMILASGNSFNLYKYNIDTSTDDIKRYESKSRYKLVKQFSMEQANQLTCLSSANGFYSYVVLCCGSDKSVEMFDLNVGTRLSTVRDIHTRSAHAITQNLGSNYASLGSSACNIFSTSAITDGIKVWDVRTSRCVRKLVGHINRAHCCGITFSPCGRYLVSGSEDKAAYVFDLREGTVFERLTGHTDAVISVNYHPLYQEVVTGSLDGSLQLFSDR